MAFNSEGKKVANILGRRIYKIPRNQRRYVWKEDNWKEMIDDLEFSIANSSKPHFMGSIVFKKEECGNIGAGVEVYSIIDGQQRITTFLLYLSAIMFIFKERNEKDNFEGLKSYLLTTDLANNSFCKLSTERYPLLQNYIQIICEWDNAYSTISSLINNITTASKKNIELFEVVNYFYDRLKKYDTLKIEGFRNALLNTNVVEIIATSEEDAYTIFEILNARGQILEDYELIKNYIMRYYEPSNAVDNAKERWETEIIQPLGKHVSHFVKHYVTHRYGKSGSGHNFNYDIIKTETDKHNVIQLLDDLCRKSSYYKIIVDPHKGEDGNCSDLEYEVYTFMKSNRGVLFRPMFLTLLHRYMTGEIKKEIYEEVLSFIKYYFICYNLLGRLTSNKLTDIVLSSAKNLEMEYSAEGLQKFIKGLIRRLPTLEEFSKSFQSIGYSKINEFHKDSSQRRRVQIALETLEAIKSGVWISDSYSIEHLHPDSANRVNANIGNLVMLETRKNESNKNKSFEEKVNTYFDSRYQTTRNVYKRYHEKPETFNIEVRAQAMAKVIFEHITEIGNSLLDQLSNNHN